MTVLSPPQMIGTADVARVLGLSTYQVRDLAKRRDPRILPGYLGKVCERHTWNAHEFLAPLYTDTATLDRLIAASRDPDSVALLCEVDGCVQPSAIAGLCARHLRVLLSAMWTELDHGEALRQLVAMCRWVIDRWPNVLPADYDPFTATECVTAGCDGSTNDGTVTGPLCRRCLTRWRKNRQPLAPLYHGVLQ